ncbi:amine sulfotransferase-like [Argopecten irradians]|uniref:amine sulfotransferase-like n=1 Tax=Argopecten irradians TaxID=31199 RepID=UPI0037201BC7
MSEPVEVRSTDGSFMKMFIYNGKYYVAHFVGNVKDHLAAIETMEVREDDTFVLSYPKSGTHWAYTLTSMLRSGETTYPGSPTFLDYTDMETINNLPSPRVLASHLTFDFMPEQLKAGKGKVIAIFRNPKDAITSLHVFGQKLDHGKIREAYNVSWEGLLEFHYDSKIFYGSWFEYIQNWDTVRRDHKGNNILYLTYEDMIQDLSSHVKKMASFLGVSCGQDMQDKVTEKGTFKNMATEAGKAFNESDQWKEVSNDKTLPIYRKGMIGDWKNYFTVAQNEYFDKVYNEAMKNSSFRFRFE